METKEKIAVLRAALAAMDEPGQRVGLGHPRADGSLSGGLRRGALHEVYGGISHEAAATGFVAGLAVRLGGPVLWIRQDYCGLEHGELAATGLLEFGLDPSRLVLLRVPDAANALRAASDALTCSALGTVVIELMGSPKVLDLVAYRRLALGAGESGVTPFLLRFSADPCAGSAETRWLVRAAASEDGDTWGRPTFDVELQRNRHGTGGHWLMEWSCDDGVFRPAASGTVVSTPADGSSAAAMVA